MDDILFKKSAVKELNKVPVYDKERIINAIHSLAENPYDNTLDIKKLTDEPGSRLRVGDWRVIYSKEDALKIISITRVKHRKEAYK